MKILRIVLGLLFIAITSQAKIKMAITVDDLPNHGNLPPGVSRKDVTTKILSVLKKHKVPEVYGFINAGRTDDNKEALLIFKMWRSVGYPLGNHTFNHMGLYKNTVEDFTKNISFNESALKELNGDTDWKYFRYPYLQEGDTLEKRNTVRKYLKDHKYQIAQVTVDFEDWSWNNPYARCKAKNDNTSIAWLQKTYLKNAEDMLDRAELSTKALFKKSIPHILLLHIGAFDAEMIDQLITIYKKKGVEFIPLSEAVKDDIYSIDPAFPAPWGSELQYQVMKSRNLTLKDLGLTKYTEYPEEQLNKICL